ncbi:MAG: DUF6475 domain-containing protein [Burkholderiaceae bacterium]
MQPSDKSKFMEVLAGVHDFYGKDLSPFAMQVWLQAVASVDIDQVTKAFSAHLHDPERGQFMPKPADLVRQLVGTHADRSLVAWGKVNEAMRAVGAYESVVFDDPTIHAAIEDIGGWPAVCAGKVDELPHLQRRFCDSHRAYSKRPGHAYQARLPGIYEGQNATAGKRVAPPVLIGDPGLCKQVLAGGTSAARVQITQQVGGALLLPTPRKASA